MNARKYAKRMLWVGATLIIAGTIATIVIQTLMRTALPSQQLQGALATPMTLLSFAIRCGCAFIAVSFPLRALHGRQVSVNHRRPLARILLVAGIACVAIGVASRTVVSGLSQLLLMSNTGQDILYVLGSALFPIFSDVIPTIGIVVIPASILQGLIERDAATHEKIFTGRTPE